ncbi:MAG TPA: type II toxin-antitoxin system RelE/ParE family toxin [Thermodesulfobacteriota bacterium]|nr:type II toxin-antitoxin system RelE/ParE family toxin [Thermodesulfobacteriota bacterium]
MDVITTRTFDLLFKKLSPQIQLKAIKKTDLFKANPFHPSLKIEKLHPRHYNVWSFRVDLHYRIIFRFLKKDTAAFLFVGHHNEIYDYDFFK